MNGELLDEARRLHQRILRDPEHKRQIIQDFYSEKVDAGQRDEANLILIIRDIEMVNATQPTAPPPPHQPPKWLQPAGVSIGVFTLLFFMLIVLLGVIGYVVPPPTKFALVAVLALGSAFAAAAWIGSIVLSGDVASPNSQKPLVVSATGGFAVFVIAFALGYWLYIK
jgi:hypothetical protein